MHTRRMRSTVDGPAPRRSRSPWLIGTLAVLFVAGGGALVSVTEHPHPAPAALTGQDTDVTAVATTQLNLRGVATGDTTVDLAETAIVGHLTAGSQAKVTCRFIGTEAPGAGNQWYQIAGPNLTALPAGSRAVASAAYLTVAGGVSVPSCPANSRTGFGENNADGVSGQLSNAAAHSVQATVSATTVQLQDVTLDQTTNPGTATCTVNHTIESRFSECQDVTVTVKAVKLVDGNPVVDGIATFTVNHTMTLNAKSVNWNESFDVSQATVSGYAQGISVNMSAQSGNGTTARVNFMQGHILDSGPATGTVAYSTTPIPRKSINAKTQTTYTFSFTKPGYLPGRTSYRSSAYRCDNYYGTSGCAMTDAPTLVSMVGLPNIGQGIRDLRANGGNLGDPAFFSVPGHALHWMIDDAQKDRNRAAVCGGQTAPPAMQAVGRTTCDEYPFASTYEGGTTQPANQRETTWVEKKENDRQGAFVTNWRRAFHVMDGDPFYVVA